MNKRFVGFSTGFYPGENVVSASGDEFPEEVSIPKFPTITNPSNTFIDNGMLDDNHYILGRCRMSIIHNVATEVIMESLGGTCREVIIAPIAWTMASVQEIMMNDDVE